MARAVRNAQYLVAYTATAGIEVNKEILETLIEAKDKSEWSTEAINQAKLDYTMLEVRFKLTEEEGKDGQAGSSYVFYNTPDWERETLETISERQRKERNLEALSVQLDRNSAILLRWSILWKGILISEEDLPENEELKERKESLANQIKNAEKLITDTSVQDEIDERKKFLDELERDRAELDSNLAEVVNQLPADQGRVITGTSLVQPIIDQAASQRETIGIISIIRGWGVRIAIRTPQPRIIEKVRQSWLKLRRQKTGWLNLILRKSSSLNVKK